MDRKVILLLGSLLLASCATQRATQSACLQAELRLPRREYPVHSELDVRFAIANCGTGAVTLLTSDSLWLPFDFVLRDSSGRTLPITDAFKWATPGAGRHILTTVTLAPGAVHVEQIPFHRWIRSDTPGESVTSIEGQYVLEGYYRVPFEVRTGPDSIGIAPRAADASPCWSGTLKTDGVQFEIAKPRDTTQEEADGPLAIILLKDARHISSPERHVMLQLDYGLIISNADTNRPPAYYLFSRKERRRFRTENVNAFLLELSRIPDGRAVDMVSKCTVPFYTQYGAKMDAEYARVMSMLKKKQCILVNSLEEDPRHASFCYCETGFTILDGQASAGTGDGP